MPTPIFQTTADKTLDYCLDRPRNRIIIALPGTAKKSFTLVVQTVKIPFQQGEVHVIRIGDRVVGMSLFPNDSNKTFETLENPGEPGEKDKLIKMLWDRISSHPRLSEVPTSGEITERN